MWDIFISRKCSGAYTKDVECYGYMHENAKWGMCGKIKVGWGYVEFAYLIETMRIRGQYQCKLFWGPNQYVAATLSSTADSCLGMDQ